MSRVFLVRPEELVKGFRHGVTLNPQAPRAFVKLVRSGGEFMGLKVKHHLQLVLQVTKKEVSLSQLIMFVGGEKMMLQELLQRFKGTSFPEIRMIAPVNELQCLSKEFDFANSARPQFDVQGLFLLAA